MRTIARENEISESPLKRPGTSKEKKAKLDKGLQAENSRGCGGKLDNLEEALAESLVAGTGFTLLWSHSFEATDALRHASRNDYN